MRHRIVLVPTLGVNFAKPFPLEGKCLLGRSSKCDVMLEHPSISRRHAILWNERDQFQVSDLQSRNGTFIDNVRVIGSAIARLGSRLRFGSLEFVASTHDGPDDSPDSNEETDPTCPPEVRPAGQEKFGRLSTAQQKVCRLLLQGLQEKQIAARLSLSPFTVHNHITAIYRAFRVHSRGELLILALGGNPSG